MVNYEDLEVKEFEEDLNIYPTKFSKLKLEKQKENFSYYSKIPKEYLYKISNKWIPIPLKDINIRKEIIKNFAYVNIYWKKEENCLIYEVEEPILTEEEQKKFKRIRELLINYLDIFPKKETSSNTLEQYLLNKLNEIIFKYSIDLTKSEYIKIKYYVIREFIGYGKIDVLLKDPQIEDISCDGEKIPIYVYHRKFGSLKTNIVFEKSEEIDNLVIKLSQKCGKHVSISNPIIDGALPDGSRVSATYSPEKDISTKGSVFTIRKFTDDPLTITDLINYGTIPSLIGAYLWLIIEFKKSGLISGGTATGKTSVLTTISSFIEPNSKIITIEDTPELKLPHEHWVSKVTRTSIGSDNNEDITLFDHLKVALRERPDWIVVGEVRGEEANVLFQAMATGHAGLATIHADSVNAVVNRLKTPPISLPVGLLQHLNFIIILIRTKVNGRDVRRIKELVEIIGIDPDTGEIITNPLFRWVASGDYYEFVSESSYLIGKISDERGIDKKEIWNEINRRKLILDWFKSKNIRYYKEVGEYIKKYYSDPSSIIEMIKNEDTNR